MRLVSVEQCMEWLEKHRPYVTYSMTPEHEFVVFTWDNNPGGEVADVRTVRAKTFTGAINLAIQGKGVRV